MGDLVEFTTWPKHQNVFYNITSNALTFEVKGDKNAAIGLASEPGNECQFWILLGYRNQCWIIKSSAHYSHLNIPNVLSKDKYKKFWITWNKGKIMFGRSNQNHPLLLYNSFEGDLFYVTFTVLGKIHTLKWKFYLPPHIENKPLKRIIGGEPHWVKLDKIFPDDAIICGFENEILYIIRQCQEEALIISKLSLKQGLKSVSLGDDVQEKDNIEVLCGYDYTWVKTIKNMIPVGAVEGGYSKYSQEVLYVGRALCDKYVIPGYVQPSCNGCFISYDGNKLYHQEYEILVTPYTTNPTVNDFYLSGVGPRNTRMQIA